MDLNDPAAVGYDPYAGLLPLAITGAQHAIAEELDLAPALPSDHPAWRRDVVALSTRVRALVARLEPIAVRVLTFWDHAVRSVVVGSARRLDVDPSGCYRLR